MGIVTALLVTLALPAGPQAADGDNVPPNLPSDHEADRLPFLKAHEKPDRYIPPGARIVRPDSSPPANLPDVPVPPNTTIKQYTVQISLQRPVPDRPPPDRVDVYYYRPNPAGGK